MVATILNNRAFHSYFTLFYYVAQVPFKLSQRPGKRKQMMSPSYNIQLGLFLGVLTPYSNIFTSFCLRDGIHISLNTHSKTRISVLHLCNDINILRSTIFYLFVGSAIMDLTYF